MLRSKKILMILLVGLLSFSGVFAQSDLTYSLVDKYLAQANDAYDDGNVEDAYKKINGCMSIAKSNNIMFEANTIMLGQSIYTTRLKGIQQKYDESALIDVKANLEKFPEISSTGIRKLISQIEAAEDLKKEQKRDQQFKQQTEDNQKMMSQMKETSQKQAEQMTDLMTSQKEAMENTKTQMNELVASQKEAMEAQKEANETNRELADAMKSSVESTNSGIGKIVMICIIILVVIVIVIVLIMFIVRAASKQNQMQHAQYVEAFKLLAAGQTQTNQLMLGGITELYNSENGLRLEHNSRWGQDALPEPEQSPEQKAQLQELAQKCTDLGAKIDQVTGRKNNSKNVSELVYKIAMNLGLSQTTSMIYFCASMVYDAGFLGVDQELLTAENLTPEQRKFLQRHVDLADSYIEFVPKKYWEIFINAAKYHHENMDGSGMPEGINGDHIPEIARIIRVVDSYIALSSKRAYRGGLDKDTAIEKLEEQSNIYDKDVIAVLKEII